MSDPDHTLLERRLLREIAEIDARIAELTANKRSLEQLVVRVRRENPALGGGSRKNSVGRVLVENAITESLKASPKPLSGSDLFRLARMTDFGLKEVTFRSHLHRLKARGVIQNPPGRRGFWRLSPVEAVS
jgi:hypothetical protein